MSRLSIKLKITLWFTALMVALAAATLIVLFQLGERTALRSLRLELADAVEDSFEELTAPDGQLIIDDDLDYFNDGVYLLLFNEEGHPLFGRLPRGLSVALPFRDGVFQSSSGGGMRWQVYDALVTVGGYGKVWVRGAASVSGTENAFQSLYRLALILLPLLALLAALGGYLLADRGFRPVRRITQTAEKIVDGADLTQRIALPPGQDELHILAAAFDRMFDRLEASFEREKRFTSDASHELRTPVAVILAQCDNALDDPTLAKEAREGYVAIARQGRHMSALIAQLLTLARADKGHRQFSAEPINLSALCELAADEVSEAAAAKQITIHQEITPDLIITGDETMLIRLWLNLMENGVKYGRTGGNLWVRLRRDGNAALGEVEDDGLGIAADELPKIWDRFYRVGEVSRRSGAADHCDEKSSDQQDAAAAPNPVGGTGLGLPMAKFITEAHGGDISAASIPGEGSLFTVRLPLETSIKKISPS